MPMRGGSSSSSSSSSSSARRRKRQWLRAIGALAFDPLQPSTSYRSGTLAAPSITSALIKSTLVEVCKEDGHWVALACLDAIQQGAAASNARGTGAAAAAPWQQLYDDTSLVEEIIDVGIQATDIAAHTPEASLQDAPKTVGVLQARRTLLTYKRRLSVWQKVCGKDASQQTSRWEARDRRGDLEDAPGIEDDGDYDAWAEVADTTPTPAALHSMRPNVLGFLCTAPALHATQLALAFQPTQLVSFLQALPPPLVEEVASQRLGIVKALLMAWAATGGDIGAALSARLLPGCQNGRESGLWAQLNAEQASTEIDITDRSDIRALLQQPGIASPLQHSPGSTVEMSTISQTSLAAFYYDLIIAMERELAASQAACHLAALVISPQIGLVQDDLLRLAEDLRFFTLLTYSPSASPQARLWTFEQFQRELSHHYSSVNLAYLASMFVEGAESQEQAITGFKEGASPFLKTMRLRAALEDPSASLTISAEQDAISMLLHFASQSNLRGLAFLMESAEQSGLPVGPKCRLCVSVSTILAHQSVSSWQAQLLERLLPPSTIKDSVTAEESIVPLQIQVGSLLNTAASHVTPETIYNLLQDAPEEALIRYADRCRSLLEGLQHLRNWGAFVTLPWLAGTEGDRQQQMNAVTRIVRSVPAAQVQSQHYNDVASTLMECVGRERVFDKLSQTDVIRSVIEGAARIGDARVFWQVFQSEDDGALSPEAREDVLIDAVRELYDNASSANLHQGDMRVAFEMLQMSRESSQSSPRVQREQEFIEATSRLCSYRIQSNFKRGIPITPIEIRLCEDRIDLIQRLLASREDVYKAPDLVLDLAFKLCSVEGGALKAEQHHSDKKPLLPNRTEIEGRTLGLLCEAAMAQADYLHAETMCERLISSVTSLSKRSEQAKRTSQTERMQTHKTTELYEVVRNITHRTCHQLAKQPDWPDYARRLRWAAYALAYCPPQQLSKYMSSWRELAQHLEAELQSDPSKGVVDELNTVGVSSAGMVSATGAASMGLHLGSGLSAALQQARAASGGSGASGLGAAGLAALSQFGGSLESYANPLGSLFSRAPAAMRPLSAQSQNPSHPRLHPNEQSVHGADINQSLVSSSTSGFGSPGSRTARLFDGLGGGTRSPPSQAAALFDDGERRAGEANQPAYLDPAERAARAARRFFGGFS